MIRYALQEFLRSELKVAVDVEAVREKRLEPSITVHYLLSQNKQSDKFIKAKFLLQLYAPNAQQVIILGQKVIDLFGNTSFKTQHYSLVAFMPSGGVQSRVVCKRSSTGSGELEVLAVLQTIGE